MRIGSCIRTYTGIEFWPLDPRADEISTRDIAHALSLTCRANGHAAHFFSVAQHSIYCAREAKNRGYSERVQLACLLHDASEAYISDITRPVKRHLTDYMKIEDTLQKTIYETYGLVSLTEAELDLVRLIDDAMLKYEMATLLNMNDFQGEEVQERYSLSFKMMDVIEEEFVRLAEELQTALLIKA
ncbi:HD domain-containing protein [Bacillus sp. FJAT-50079]|uniref:HD domain-containing protein n=1 Tax=Bacillus sp. FJAT-50079 TaxID=2833577 RepID=UPI001BC9E64C|nr:HD domain-containing protein [Bacillus sp. FJAT-50079]MBS4210036.1 HD domain-containing protein [Bacillus sp. FJAT-50079]